MKALHPGKLLVLLTTLLISAGVLVAQPDDRGPRGDRPVEQDAPPSLSDEQKEQIDQLNERYRNAMSDLKSRLARLENLYHQQIEDGNTEAAAETRKQMAELREQMAQMHRAYLEALREIKGNAGRGDKGDRDGDTDEDVDSDRKDRDKDGDRKDRDKDDEGEGDGDGNDDLRDKGPCPEARAIMERLREARKLTPEEREQAKALHESFREYQEGLFAQLRELQAAYREAVAEGDEEAAARARAALTELHEQLRAAHERLRNALSELVGEDRREEIESLREQLREAMKDCDRGPQDRDGDHDRRRGRNGEALFHADDFPSIQ